MAAAITKAEISVEEIQDMVEERLMKRNPSIAKRYIIYREWRNVERDRRFVDQERHGRHRDRREERHQPFERQHVVATPRRGR